MFSIIVTFLLTNYLMRQSIIKSWTPSHMSIRAAHGAASGAVIGAIIGNNTGSGDASTGAAIGAVVGGAGGAYAGSQKDKAVGEPTRIRQSASGQELIYDGQAGRYYYADRNTGRTYWQDGSIRSY